MENIYSYKQIISISEYKNNQLTPSLLVSKNLLFTPDYWIIMKL